jgi:parallel beta-helix repeat protein
MSVLPIFRRRLDRSSRSPEARARRRQPLVEALEGRQLLATFLVTNTGDSGAGSLRQAINLSNANSSAAANTIDFKIPGGGIQTIALTSALPAITHPVTIDGTTQPGSGAAPRIVLSGTNAGGSASGLAVQASGTTVKGLAIDAFAQYGVVLNGTSGDTVTDDFIGVTAAGNVASGNGLSGVEVTDGARANLITDNVISGNGARGVDINSSSDQNMVASNLIGTDSTGTHALGNTWSGVYVGSGSSGNVIGGTTPGSANTLSGNGARGVRLDTGADYNVVEGNYIGTNCSGTAALGNDLSGVSIDNGSAGNVIGGTVSGAGNVISGNGLSGVSLCAAGPGNLIEGDTINSNGFNQTVAGHGDGVFIDDTPDTTVSNCTIENNRDWGILLNQSGNATLTNNTFKGNGLGGVHTN